MTNKKGIFYLILSGLLNISCNQFASDSLTPKDFTELQKTLYVLSIQTERYEFKQDGTFEKPSTFEFKTLHCLYADPIKINSEYYFILTILDKEHRLTLSEQQAKQILQRKVSVFFTNNDQDYCVCPNKTLTQNPDANESSNKTTLESNNNNKTTTITSYWNWKSLPHLALEGTIVIIITFLLIAMKKRNFYVL